MGGTSVSSRSPPLIRRPLLHPAGAPPTAHGEWARAGAPAVWAHMQAAVSAPLKLEAPPKFHPASAAVLSAAAAVGQSAPDAPEGWSTQWSAKYRTHYFYHDSSGRSSWELPAWMSKAAQSVSPTGSPRSPRSRRTRRTAVGGSGGARQSASARDVFERSWASVGFGSTGEVGWDRTTRSPMANTQSSWWGSTVHSFDEVRAPTLPSPKPPADSPFGPRGWSRGSLYSRGTAQRRAATAREDRRLSASDPAAEGLRSPRGAQAGRLGRSLSSSRSFLQSSTSKAMAEHGFVVQLPYELKQNDGGLSAAFKPWVEHHGAVLPREFLHGVWRPPPQTLHICSSGLGLPFAMSEQEIDESNGPVQCGANHRKSPT